jgi:hypothetical protein
LIIPQYTSILIRDFPYQFAAEQSSSIITSDYNDITRPRGGQWTFGGNVGLVTGYRIYIKPAWYYSTA